MFICNNCGADMKFDPATQMLTCEFCDTKISPADYKKAMKIRAEQYENTEKEPKFQFAQEEEPVNEESAESAADVFTEQAKKEEQAEQESFSEEDFYDAYLLTCPQCGAELLTTDETAATFCSYCGSSVLLESRLVKQHKPDYIIPFRMTREDCENAYRGLVKKSLFAPRKMLRQDTVERFRGIYMPYWVYSYEQHGTVSARGSKEHRRGDYIITKHYEVKTDIDLAVEGISYDASSSFSDNLSGAIAPFDFKKVEPFTPAYLSGFYADTDDVDAYLYEEEASDIVKDYAANQICSDHNYAAYGVPRKNVYNHINPEECKPKLGFFPVWFLSMRNPKGDRISYAVVNGQTGECAADLPIDFKKYLLGSIILAVPIFLVLVMALTMTPKITLFLAIILAFVSMLMANRQINQAYAREHMLVDLGYMSLNQSLQNNKNVKQKKKDPLMDGDSGQSSSIVATVAVCFFVMAVFAVLGLGFMSAVMMFIMIFAIVKQSPSKKKDRETNPGAGIAAKAPAKEKLKTLWKPIVGVIAAGVMLVMQPVNDAYYYIAVVVAMVFIIWAFFDVAREHNRMTTRPLPQFEERGGEDVANM